MAKKVLINITPQERSSKGVIALSDRPNVSSSYGVGGLSNTQLKLWFDKLCNLLADIIQTALCAEDIQQHNTPVVRKNV